jgi:two-component system cell cycle sensor histidine kinase/response regulator CckA
MAGRVLPYSGSVQKKILIVDDEPMVRDLCVAALTRHQFDTITSADGLDAFSTYQARREEIWLIISDIKMPRMDGIELVRNVFDFYPQANVILMSGYGIEELAPTELARLCSVLEKPFSASQLVEAVRKCLKDDEEHHPFSS